MSIWREIFAQAFASAAIIAAITFILREGFKHFLLKDIANHQARLQAESEHSKIRLEKELETRLVEYQTKSDLEKVRLEKELQTKLFEYQTKFPPYHQMRAEAIREIYGMLCENNKRVYELVNFAPSNDEKPLSEKIQETVQSCRILDEFFVKHRIYLDKSLCDEIDAAMVGMDKVISKVCHAQKPWSNNTLDSEQLHDAWKLMDEQVTSILQTLEELFRECLSGVQNKDGSQLTRKGMEV